MNKELNVLHNTTELDNQYDDVYKVTPYRISYSMSTSEFGIIVLMLALILITLILICIASNLKTSFKKKMANLGVVVLNVNGKKKAVFQNQFNALFQAPVDLTNLRTTSFMNVALPEYVLHVFKLNLKFKYIRILFNSLQTI